MSLLENLPVDIHTPTQQEEQVVDILFQKDHPAPSHSTRDGTPTHSRDKHAVLQGFEEGLVIVILFLVFSLPHVTTYLESLSFLSGSLGRQFVIKILLILILYGIIKKYYL